MPRLSSGKKARAPPARTARAKAPVKAAKVTLKTKRALPPDAFDASLEQALVLDRKGYPYLVHPLLDGVPRCPPELLEAWVAWARKQPMAERATLLMAPEAMGLPLVAPLAMALGIPYVVVRKRKYGLPGEHIAYAETGYGEAALHINGVEPGDRILLVDNVLSTGGTLGSLLSTLSAMGATVVGALVALDKGRWREDLQERFDVPIHAMRTIRVDSGKVTITRRG